MIKIFWNQYEDGAEFSDSYSIYENNAAVKGGVYYLSNVKASFYQSEFSSSTAWYGGVMYI